MESKNVKITIEFNGKRYRVSKSFACLSKRDCSLFKPGVCDSTILMGHEDLPCAPILDGFEAIGCHAPTQCFKEVK